MATPLVPLSVPHTKFEAALESVWVTFLAIGGGMIVAATAAGASTPSAVLTYARENWLVWAATNLIAPAIRFYRQPPTP